MKTTRVLFVIFSVIFLVPMLVATAAAPAAQSDSSDDNLVGTWSGSWVPPGGVRDAVTVEVKRDDGKLSGRFVTPKSMTFSKASFNAKNHTVLLEATDQASGKQYKIEARMEGTELTGSLTENDVRGDLRLIKWTYVPRIGR